MMLFYALLIGLVTGNIDRYTPRRCEGITVPMCKGIGYNTTYMPNQFMDENQEEASLEIQQFWPLVEIKCSSDLQFFLCSMYTPICVNNYNKHLPACRSVCERAKKGCTPIMEQYGFPWPERMRCEDLPEFGDKDNLCMDFNTTGTESSSTTQSTLKPNLPYLKHLTTKTSGFKSLATLKPDEGYTLKTLLGNTEQPVNYLQSNKIPNCKRRADCSCRSPSLLKITKQNQYYNKISTAGIANCAISCQRAYFSEQEQQFAVFWIAIWSSLCFLSTLSTVTTFLMDTRRFEYPERPIIFLSGCYLMVSLGYIIRLIAGHEAVACQQDIIRYETTGPVLCMVVFLLIYFFSMASSIWWVILSFTWFLAAGLKWGQEAITSYSHYFHVAAWLLPSIKTITILALGGIDGDPVSGICFVGNHNITNLRGLVLAPLFIYLLIGIIFLLAGFVNLFRIRHVIKQQGQQKTAELEKLMIRILVFSVLYTVPASIVIGCYFYEQYYKELWDISLTCQCTESSYTPDYAVFMLKYFMCLVVGITSGFWVWTSKTVQTWRSFCSKCRCTRQPDMAQSKYTSATYQCAEPPPVPPSVRSCAPSFV